MTREEWISTGLYFGSYLTEEDRKLEVSNWVHRPNRPCPNCNDGSKYNVWGNPLNDNCLNPGCNYHQCVSCVS